MSRFLFLLAALTFFGVWSLASTAHACPNCKEAIATSGDSDDDDPMREARAYNYNIYLMVAMPYFLLGTAGYFVYRGLRSAQKKAEENANPPALPSP